VAVEATAIRSAVGTWHDSAFPFPVRRSVPGLGAGAALAGAVCGAGDFTMVHEPFSYLAEFGQADIAGERVTSAAGLISVLTSLGRDGRVFAKETTSRHYPEVLANRRFLAAAAMTPARSTRMTGNNRVSGTEEGVDLLEAVRPAHRDVNHGGLSVTHMLDGTVGRRFRVGGCSVGLACCLARPLDGMVRLAADLLACLRGIHVKVTAAWPHVCAGAGPAMPPSSAAVWNTDQLPGLARLSAAFPTSTTSSSHHRTSATCRMRLTAIRSRSSGIGRSS
jgi:hypothetical protein